MSKFEIFLNQILDVGATKQEQKFLYVGGGGRNAWVDFTYISMHSTPVGDGPYTTAIKPSTSRFIL